MFASIFLSRFTATSSSAAEAEPALWVGLGLGYLAVGAVCCWRLAQTGYPAATAFSSIGCWPLMWSLLQRQHLPGDRDRSDRIDTAIAELRGSLDRADAALMPPGLDLDRLRQAMHRVNARISWADRLLADQQSHTHDPASKLGQTLQSLAQHRQHAADELDTVLSILMQLRIQLGMQDLADGNAPVAACLQDLQTRVDTLRALASLEQSTA